MAFDINNYTDDQLQNLVRNFISGDGLEIDTADPKHIAKLLKENGLKGTYKNSIPADKHGFVGRWQFIPKK